MVVLSDSGWLAMVSVFVLSGFAVDGVILSMIVVCSVDECMVKLDVVSA